MPFLVWPLLAGVGTFGYGLFAGAKAVEEKQAEAVTKPSAGGVDANGTPNWVTVPLMVGGIVLTVLVAAKLAKKVR